MAKQHARYSPSKLDSLARCVRFRYIEREDDSANEGTLLHEACERESLEGLNEEQRNAVTTVIDYVRVILSTEGGPENWHDLREVRLRLGDLTYGHADRVLIHKEKPIAHVMDWKFTRIAGDHTFQVKTYGAALVSEINGGVMSPIRDRVRHTTFVFENAPIPTTLPCPELETVTTHVVAPRLHEPTVREYTASVLYDDVVATIDKLYARIDDPWTPPAPGEGLCDLCARAATCPALTAVVLATAPQIGLPLPSAFAPEAMTTVKDRAIAQVLAGALENWADQIKKNNTAYVEAGGQIPGFKMVERSTGMRVDQGRMGEALDLAAEKYGREAVQASVSLSISKLAKNVSEVTGSPESQIKGEIQELLGERITEGQTRFLMKTKRTSDAALVKQITEGE